MLAYIVAGLGAGIALVGVAAAAIPSILRELMRSMQGRRALYGAVAGRILAGGFLIFASDACAWPMAIGTLGVVILATGLTGLFIGMPRTEALMAWFLGMPDGVFRVWGAIALLLGAFIITAAV